MKLKVLHIINSLTVAGAETLLANSLAKGGLQEHTDNMVIYFKVDSALLDIIDKDVKVVNLQYKGWFTICSLLMKIRKIIKTYKPDIIHTHLNPAGWYTALARPKHIPQVHTLHISYSTDTDTDKRRLFFEKILLLQRKDANLITLLPILKDDLINAIKIKGDVFVLPDFIADKFFTENPQTPQGKTFRLVAVGNMRPQKNYNYLLEIFRHLKGEGVSVDIYGFGDHSVFSKIAKDENLSVRFMGPAEDTKDIYWRYNGFLMPSKFEGFGLSVYEAMASGLPLLLSDIDAFKSPIKDNALYFSLSDAGAAANMIRDVVYGKIDIKQITARAKQYARQTVRRDIYIKTLLTIYNDVLQKTKCRV